MAFQAAVEGKASMPQLFSRMDDLNWVTPTISDILDQGAAPPGGDGSIREQMLMLQRKLGELETPARVINVRPTPSYTMFIAKPDVVNWQGNRRAVTINEIKRSIGQIAEENKDWKLGFLPQLQEVADTVGILLRMDSHQPLNLRRLLVRTNFRNAESTLSIALGNTLEQQLIVRDLGEIGNILIAGKLDNRKHLLNNILLTLLTLNTPGELRLVVAGQSAASHLRKLVNVPHALGRVLSEPTEAHRLIDGLAKELERRQQGFAEAQVDNFNDYNAYLKEQGKTIAPRLILVVDSISDPGWEVRENWLPALQSIALNSGRAGVHLIVTSEGMGANFVPETLQKSIRMGIAMRSAANDYAAKLDNFHGSLVRFVDAFIIENNEQSITPIETALVSEEELEKTIAYWYQAAKQRELENQATKISGKTGVTGVLKQVPPADTDEDKRLSPVPPSARATTEAVVTETAVVATDVTETTEEVDYSVRQAQALAAYLGWIGVGPLQDILGMTANEAQRTINALKKLKVVENGNSTTPRFIRLSPPPEHE
ncbi:MAG: hypothetical protein OHK0046_07070 [Anaerolineae bacterium]